MRKGLPWGRLDADWMRHRKFKELTRRRQWRAIVVYFAALAYSIESGSDGYIAPVDLGEVLATRREVETLLAVGLWDMTPDEHGWMIHNYGNYQQSSAVSAMRSDQAQKAAIARWHGRDP